MSYVIAIDPSLRSSGIVVFNKKGSPVHYECVLPESLSESDRLLYNYQRFCNIFSSYYPISCISFEGQISQMRYNHNAKGILSLAENIGVLKLAIRDKAFPYNEGMKVLSVPPGDIKSFATGNSKSDKDAMMNAVDGRHMKSIKSVIPEGSINDVCDAYHLGKMTLKLLEDESYLKYLYLSREEELVSNA